ncbi:hypothetical protein [Actinacidiphila sp. bgisy144]|uniref:hypothetical protein n=1 Tax=unclassified Actinacidiphila TaxID=2995708 RepID=UPI003EBC7258
MADELVPVAGRGPAWPFVRAAEEAGAGLREPTERTRRRLVDALEDAAEHDENSPPHWQRAR